MLATISQAFELIGERWRRRWMWLLPLGAATALIEMVGASAVFILIRLITDASAADSIRPVAQVRRWLELDAETTTVVLAVLVAALFVIKAGLRIAEVYLLQRWAHGALMDLSARLLAAYLEAPYSFHLRRNSADLIRALHHDVHTVCAIALHALATAINEVLVALAVIFVLILVTPGPSLVVAIVIALLTIAMLSLSQRMTTRWGDQLHRLTASKLRTVQQAFGAAKELRLLGRHSYFLDEFRRVMTALEETEVGWGTFQWLPRLTVETILVCGIAAVVVVAHLAGTAPWLLAPTLGIFAFAALRLLPSFHLILHHLNRLQLSAVGVAAVHADFKALAHARPQPSSTSAATIPIFSERIQLERVSFSYDGERVQALSEIDLAISRGESVGIVGSTGAGKSTLVDLLLGLLTPTQGRISIDGRDMREQITAWQRQLGYVPQQLYLLDDTIRANIAFAIEDAEIRNDRVLEVARMAQLESWIETLPAGLDTVVGERGVRLSGGERQRIAIARALYHDPAVLVFDEATAALDHQTEKDLTDTIVQFHGRKTMVIIAHRLSTVRGCDRLIFLRAGRVVDIGSYDDLIRRNPDFERMAAGA